LPSNYCYNPYKHTCPICNTFNSGEQIKYYHCNDINCTSQTHPRLHSYSPPPSGLFFPQTFNHNTSYCNNINENIYENLPNNQNFQPFIKSSNLTPSLASNNKCSYTSSKSATRDKNDENIVHQSNKNLSQPNSVSPIYYPPSTSAIISSVASLNTINFDRTIKNEKIHPLIENSTIFSSSSSSSSLSFQSPIKISTGCCVDSSSHINSMKEKK
jgi:hypothetical protein